MRTFYDSTSVSDIPKSAKGIVAYADGAYKQTLIDAQARRPKITVWTVSTQGDVHANFYDREGGLLSTGEAVACAKGNVQRGEFSGIYVDASGWPEVRKAVADAGLSGKVKYWIAHYDGDGTISEPDQRLGCVGKQYLSPGIPGAEAGGHYDVSVFLDNIPGLDPAPKPTKKPVALSLTSSSLITVIKPAATRLTRRLAKRHAPLPVHGKEVLRGLAKVLTALLKQVERVIAL